MKYADLPRWLRQRYEQLRLWKGIDWDADYDDEDNFETGDSRLASMLPGAEAVSSKWRKTGDGYDHMILIDLDVQAALIPSSTSNHSHLYIDNEVKWEDYLNLLRAMQKCGIVEEGYVNATEQRGEAFLRLPWIRKGQEADDARKALEEWLDGKTETQIHELNGMLDGHWRCTCGAKPGLGENVHRWHDQHVRSMRGAA